MKIEEIIFWVLFSMGILVVIWYILGQSPTIDQALLILILAMVIKNSISIKGLKSDFKHSETKFKALASDFKAHIKHK